MTLLFAVKHILMQSINGAFKYQKIIVHYNACMIWY